MVKYLLLISMLVITISCSRTTNLRNDSYENTINENVKENHITNEITTVNNQDFYSIENIILEDFIGIWRTNNNINYEFRFYKDKSVTYRKIEVSYQDVGKEIRYDGVFEFNKVITIKILEKRILVEVDTENEDHFDGIGWTNNKELIDKEAINPIKIESFFTSKEDHKYFSYKDEKYWKVTTDPFEP